MLSSLSILWQRIIQKGCAHRAGEIRKQLIADILVYDVSKINFEITSEQTKNSLIEQASQNSVLNCPLLLVVHEI